VALLAAAGVASQAALEGVGETATMAVISPSGGAAAFYSEGTRQIEVVTGLPANARRAFSRELDAPAVVSLAVNDSGEVVLCGVREGERGEVLALRANGPATPVLQAGWPSAIAFARHSRQAVIADRTLNQVIAADVRPEGANVRILAGAADNIAAPEALAVQGDLSRVLVLNRGNRSILVLSLTGKGSTILECPFDGAGIGPLREEGLYAVWSADGHAAGLLRTDTVDVQFSSVPAVEGDSAR
jgi:hypothetical protein